MRLNVRMVHHPFVGNVSFLSVPLDSSPVQALSANLERWTLAVVRFHPALTVLCWVSRRPPKRMTHF